MNNLTKMFATTAARTQLDIILQLAFESAENCEGRHERDLTDIDRREYREMVEDIQDFRRKIEAALTETVPDKTAVIEIRDADDERITKVEVTCNAHDDEGAISERVAFELHLPSRGMHSTYLGRGRFRLLSKTHKIDDVHEVRFCEVTRRPRAVRLCKYVEGTPYGY